MAQGGDGREVQAGDNLDAALLLSIITRLESLDREKRAIATDAGVIKAEAKAAGFQLDVINFILRERRKNSDDIDEFNRELNTYKSALGMVHDL